MLDPTKLDEQRTFFANRLKKRFKHLWKYAKRVGTTAFRVYHRDIPEIPFAVDWYDGHLHVAEYARPHDRTSEQHEQWLAAMIETAANALTVPRERVFFKRRARQRGRDQYEPVSRSGYTLTIEEHGLLFTVNLSDYVDTGLFLDHRELRLHTAKRCPGKRVLNLFGYTGSFTVYAAAAGAAASLTLDLSNTYLDWARENMRINALPAPEHEFRRADVLREVDRLAAAGERFEVIILDPPSFSNSKNMDRTFDVQRDHVELIVTCVALLSPGGELFFSTNKRRFQFGRREILERVSPGSAINGAGNDTLAIRKLTKLTMPEDFAGTHIHQVWSLLKQPER